MGFLNIFKRKQKCNHEQWHWEWWDAGYRIKVCEDCEMQDFGWKVDSKNRQYQKWTII